MDSYILIISMRKSSEWEIINIKGVVIFYQNVSIFVDNVFFLNQKFNIFFDKTIKYSSRCF